MTIFRSIGSAILVTDINRKTQETLKKSYKKEVKIRDNT